MKTFDLFDSASGNLVGSFSSINDAYRIVREGVERYGKSAAADLMLFVIDEESQELAAEGNSLVELAIETGEPVRRLA